eukprot:1093159-Alexandrium_andersonii.AAC.1
MSRAAGNTPEISDQRDSKHAAALHSVEAQRRVERPRSLWFRRWAPPSFAQCLQCPELQLQRSTISADSKRWTRICCPCWDRALSHVVSWLLLDARQAVATSYASQYNCHFLRAQSDGHC